MKRIIFMLLYVVLFSCKQAGKNDAAIPQIMIDINDSKPLILSSLFEDVQYVPISDSIMIGEFHRLKLYDDKLFMLTNNSVIVFNINSGDVMLYIRRLGSGPGEYKSVDDMLYDQTENTVELLDRNGKKVLRYDFKGNYIDDFTTSFFSFSFFKENKSCYWFYNNNMISDITSHKLIAYNPTEKKIISQFLPIDLHLAEYLYIVDSNNFSGGPLLSFFFCPSDTIYQISPEHELLPQYTINLGSHHVPPSFYKEPYRDIADFSEKAKEHSYIYMIGNYEENAILSCFSLLYRKDWHWMLYDKRDQVIHIANSIIDDYHFKDDIHIESYNQPFVMDSSRLCFIIQSSQLINIVKSSQSKNYPVSDNILKIYNQPNFTEQSNPIMVVCKLKK